ncbi:hypothetical protein PG993_000673 [Apiospora rasikravindrae]|uniref:Transcription factor Iwr1 domain-containing protein n=1 Tax=Apiospora rasikravindrae TaxID=990691 RepID=A0ABR1UBB2_9PEZI
MSVPPQTIRVKRKAGSEDEPVSFLRLQETKRHRSESYVYQRQRQEPVFAEIPPSLQKPIIHSSPKPTNEGAAFQQGSQPNNKRKNGQGDGLPATGTAPNDAVGTPSSSEPRRFHMSKKEMMLAASQYPTSRNGGVSRKRPAPALFVERKIKRLPSKSIDRIAQTTLATDAQTQPTSLPDQASADVDMDEAEPRKFKKPGVNKLAQKTGNQKTVNAAATKPELPESMLDRRNVELDKFTEDMNAWTMQQIGLNLQQAEQEKAATAKRSQQLKYKPKVPAKRYTERHPEAPKADEDMPDAKAEFTDTDDDDYIIETYIRVPLSAMEKQNVAPGSIGLLVFDDEPDSELFYGEGSDSENEWAEDDDDENAENYYTADYPDDEVASDDEFGLNPYSFRNNASDVEEYDLDDDDSDKDGFKSFRGPDGLISKHL